MEELIEFGKIVNTHGLKGEVKVYSYTDDEQNILKLKEVYIQNTRYKVQSMKQFKNMFLMKLKDIDTIDEAEILVDKMCFRKVKNGESNEEDGYFIKDLIGIEVFENDEKIGTVKEVFKTGANDVYEIIDKNGKSIYIPAIKQVVKNIDIKSKKMIVELMKGLK